MQGGRLERFALRKSGPADIRFDVGRQGPRLFLAAASRLGTVSARRRMRYESSSFYSEIFLPSENGMTIFGMKEENLTRR
jgi:hypothetical protein